MSRDRSLRRLDHTMRDICQQAIEQGARLEVRTKHVALRLPDGSLQTIPSTAEGRTGRNTRAALRRKGMRIR